MSLVMIKLMCWQGCIPSGGSSGDSASLPFPVSSGCLNSWAHGPFQQSCPSSTSAYILPLLPWLWPTASLIWGPFWLHWSHLDNTEQSSHPKILNLITSANFHLPCKVTSCKVRKHSFWGLGHVWTSFGGGIILPTRYLRSTFTNIFLFKTETSGYHFCILQRGDFASRGDLAVSGDI